jgi:hypothetical protein
MNGGISKFNVYPIYIYIYIYIYITQALQGYYCKNHNNAIVTL